MCDGENIFLFVFDSETNKIIYFFFEFNSTIKQSTEHYKTIDPIVKPMFIYLLIENQSGAIYDLFFFNIFFEYKRIHPLFFNRNHI